MLNHVYIVIIVGFNNLLASFEARGSAVVKALYRKLEGHGFDA
jgi:hypothetical protein